MMAGQIHPTWLGTLRSFSTRSLSFFLRKLKALGPSLKPHSFYFFFFFKDTLFLFGYKYKLIKVKHS
jgi:hypothetical protein